MFRFRAPLIAALGLSAAFAPSAHAIVGGQPVPVGQRGYVAFVSLANPPGPVGGTFQCTGTLVAPDLVVTAAHCSSATGAAFGSPVGMPGQTIEVTLGSVKPNDPAGEKFQPSEVIVPPDYNGGNGLIGDERSTGDSNDFALLRLPSASKQNPVPIAAKGERDLWLPGKLAQIAGFGVTQENGDTPDVMHEAQVPIVDDAVAAAAYSSFENVTQLGAGYPEGKVDSCQGDSGGPLIVPAANGSLRLVGDTSYGQGCARPGKPGIYGRLADEKLREFIRAEEPKAIAPEPGASSPTTTTGSTGSTGSTGTTAPAGSNPAPTSTATPTPAPATVSRTAKTPLAVSAALDLRRLRRALTRGVRLRVRSNLEADVTGTLKLGSRTVARGTLNDLTGRKTATLRFTGAGRRALKARRAARLTLTVVIKSADGQTKTVSKRVTLKR